MKTFCAVDDARLVDLIDGAQERVVFIAPGLELTVAQALGKRLGDVGGIDITVILDADEDVCRIGYGDIRALQYLHAMVNEAGFALRSQPGLRVGVLLADDRMLVWSPTPRSVEAPPSSQSKAADLLDYRSPIAPNGIMLGENPREQLAMAVAAEGTPTSGPNDAEIGCTAITPQQVDETVSALASNPPIPVDLARVTRVFSTKLQFVEFKVKGGQLSKIQLRVPSDLLNADAPDELRAILESNLRAFGDLRSAEVEVPAYTNGEQAFDKEGNPIMEKACEASLDRQRHDIEKRFSYELKGFGRLVEKAEKAEFERRINAYKAQLMAHSAGLKMLLEQQTEQIINDAIQLIIARSTRATAGHTDGVPTVSPDELRKKLIQGMERIRGDSPEVSLVFKDITYEQTQNSDFRHKLKKALPAPVRKRLGAWTEQFEAAKAQTCAATATPGAPQTDKIFL